MRSAGIIRTLTIEREEDSQGEKGEGPDNGSEPRPREVPGERVTVLHRRGEKEGGRGEQTRPKLISI